MYPNLGKSLREEILNDFKNEFKQDFFDFMSCYEEISKKGAKVLDRIIDEIFDDFYYYYLGIEIDVLDILKNEFMSRILNEEIVVSMKTLKNFYRADSHLRESYLDLSEEFEGKVKQVA